MEKMFTLARGGRAREFGYTEEDNKIQIFTGYNYETRFCISDKEIDVLLKYFQNRDWFVLGNQVDNIKPNGLGQYFKSTLAVSPKFASHVAAYLVKKNKLQFRDDYGMLEFKVM